ncbi:Cystatin/monellin superfamily protein [Arabidopsis thaliana]|uniref:Cystatin/monellin superfamily protein n=1 Tax=Arabidopsis thaliana TaxID=3702 RepID=A0A1I9LNV5_ARATH|nr:Cystatin/monellin superfamily protein [Arabidopsis thaliana]ANM64263.1 Cystatin/monellin superfamily protein [Arabidopsis thaliana]|eukprot:NP_001326303.1 Cystatin/monellin superfamily protein [Arabidopsis thaliana]
MAKTDEYQICTAARNKLEEYVDPNEELKHPTWFKVPEWDVDSFEGLEYNSSEYKNEFSNDEDENQWRRFKRQLIENKGFYVERELWPWYNYSDYKVVPNLDLPASFGQTYRVLCRDGLSLSQKVQRREKNRKCRYIIFG